MKKILVGLVVVVSMFVAAPVVAAQGYFGAAYSTVMADFGPVDFDLGALTVLGGGNLNENFAVEGRLGFGVQDDDIGGLVGLELDHYLGVYGRAILPVNNFMPYLVFGFTQAEITFESTDSSGSEDDSDFSYGIGTDVKVNENMAVNLEYMYFMEFEDEVDVDGFSFGFKYFF